MQANPTSRSRLGHRLASAGLAVGLSLAVAFMAAAPAPLAAGQAERTRTADPYAGYTRANDQPRTVDRQARTVSRGAVVVERDRSRVQQVRAREAQPQPQSQPQAAPARRQTPQARAAANIYGQALLDQARRQQPDDQPQAQRRQGDETQAQAQAQAASHADPRYADSPRIDTQLHRRVAAERHGYGRAARPRHHVSHLPHPSYRPKYVISTRHQYHYRPKHRVHRPFRIHTGLRFGIHSKRFGVKYDHSLHKKHYHGKRHHVKRRHRQCSSSLRLHLRF